MTSRRKLGRAGLVCIAATLVLSACGSAAPSAAPTGAADTPAPATTLPETQAPVTEPPVTEPPVTEPPATEPPATEAPSVDPADELEIAAPYELQALDEELAGAFVTLMEASLGSMADDIQVGIRSVVGAGDLPGLVIVMRFPGLPIAGQALLDGAAAGASGGTTVEKRKINGTSVRIAETQGRAAILLLVGDDLVMVIGQTKKQGIDITTAIIKAN